MLLVDAHAHMELPHFKKDLPQVLERAKAAGMVGILAQGVHDASNRQVLELAAKYPIIKPCLGLYPLDATNVKVHEEYPVDKKGFPDVDTTLSFIKKNAKLIKSIGEVGIDLKDSDDEQHQIENFTKVLRLSHQIKKPLNIHSRKAEKLILDILEDAKSTTHLLHCFSGSKKLIKRAVNMGCYLTVTSNANRLHHFKMMAQVVPITQLLTETDAPYLSPIKDERNEPQNVQVAVDVIAKAKGLTPEETARSIYMNYQKLF